MDELFGLEEHLAFTYSSESEIDQHSATFGAPSDQAWCLSDRDVWYRNPAYQGPPQRHPEDDSQYYDDDASTDDVDYQPEAFDDEIPF